jgi:hypothetical protein
MMSAPVADIDADEDVRGAISSAEFLWPGTSKK